MRLSQAMSYWSAKNDNSKKGFSSLGLSHYYDPKQYQDWRNKKKKPKHQTPDYTTYGEELDFAIEHYKKCKNNTARQKHVIKDWSSIFPKKMNVLYTPLRSHSI